jgi:ABC-type phosphate transport system ATPase subunit
MATHSADRPLDDPTEDRFGHAEFAETLAKAIAEMGAPDRTVVALYGQWGSGKPTVLNFIERFLSEQAPDIVTVGLPSVRVNGRDVEPGVDAREAFVLACRVYQTESGLNGRPRETWVRAALKTS